jgi:protein-tyrosine phosphatase
MGGRSADDDFRRFHLILAMDEDNLAELLRLRPDDAVAELRLFAATGVPDPYMGGPEGFSHVLDLVEAASRHWVEELQRRLERGTS